MDISVVITVFNRRKAVCNAINSVFNSLPDAEIILVDDFSSDSSVSDVCSKYEQKIDSGLLRVVCHPVNMGVTAAKNTGYLAASRKWVVFLDSDDLFLEDNIPLFCEELESSAHFPIVFFRCIDQHGEFVGKKFLKPRFLNISEYLKNTSYGEALTVVNKNKVGQVLVYEDALRGYEGLGCMKLIKKFGPAYLSTVVARIYVTQGDDRLSSLKGMLSRSNHLADGHRLLLKEFGNFMTFRSRVFLELKWRIYKYFFGVFALLC